MPFVQANHAINDAAGTTLGVTLNGVATGNLICGHVTLQAVATTELTSVTDGVNTYTVVDKQVAGGMLQGTFYARNVTGGNLTITANTANDAFRRIHVEERSGLDTSAAVLNAHSQNASSAFGTAADACTSNAAATTVNGCEIVGFIYDDTSTTQPSAGTSFTLRDPFTNAAGDNLAMEDRVQATQGSVAATFTTAAGTDSIHVAMLAFAPFVGTLGPTIDVQPADQAVFDGSAVVFTVAATTSGGALSYQWQDDRSGSFANVSDGSGGTTATYTTPGSGQAYQGRQYRCLVTDSNGTTTTRSAVLSGVPIYLWSTSVQSGADIWLRDATIPLIPPVSLVPSRNPAFALAALRRF